jgi:hypothetical protein
MVVIAAGGANEPLLVQDLWSEEFALPLVDAAQVADGGHPMSNMCRPPHSRKYTANYYERRSHC